MKSVIRLMVVAAVCSVGMVAADNADVRCCFLKKLFNRGGNCCTPCETSYCAPEPDCGCGAPAATDCGCGGEVVGEMSGGVSGGVIIEEHVGEPTEVSPADTMPAVPEPPAVEDAAAPEVGDSEAVEDAAEKLSPEVDVDTSA